MIEKEDHEWHDGFPSLPKGMTVLPWIMWAAIIGLAIGAVLYAGKVKADPMAVGQAQGSTYTIYTEDCQLKDVVDLEKRATVEKDGKVVEGCVSILENMPFFVLYVDREIFLIRTSFFHRVTGA